MLTRSSDSSMGLGLTWLIILSSLSISAVFAAVEFDNEIQGKPEIECDHDSIRFKIDTMKSSPSSIYVKGNMENDECVFRDVSNATIPLNKCNMRRKREISPSGVGYTFTVVVQLHPLFITKVDRAYNVHCFYMEAQKRMEVGFEVSDLTTVSISETPPLPECVYTVRKDSLHGPLVRHARVGDALFHVWECPTQLYAMLLHSCVADDGSGNKYTVIDEKGCAVDEYLMPQVRYNDELTIVNVESNAFTFADKTSLMFMCQIQLCFKNEDCSQITPPRCGSDQELIETTTEAISTNKNSLTEELDNEQLISSSSSSTTTTTSSASTPTSASSTSTGPSIAQAVRKHPKDVLDMPADFPRPDVLPNADIEGSGEGEDATDVVSTTTTAETTTTQTLKILEKLGKTKSSNRPQRHSGPKPRSLVNMDIQSPELTIMDDYLDPAMQQTVPKPLISDAESEAGSLMRERICVPAFGLYGSGLLVFVLGCVVLVLLIKSRKQLVHKFY